jgi:hypothetical protein
MVQATQPVTTRRTSTRFTVAWVSLATIGVATLAFGLIVALVPASSGALHLRADGVALVGMGLFGALITATAYRRRDRWAWLALWYYPVFWAAHLLGGLPPGKDHVHQVVFVVLSLVGLLLPVRDFFPTGEHGRP